MRLTFSLLVFLCLNSVGLAQNICSGSLGENIFERGDFGRGESPILLTDPGIAPGYLYTTNVPSDGFYTICSNTGALNGLYPTWLSVQDNSADPNGYMMVVNASFSPGIFYEEVVEGLCENTLYEFSADIINLIQTGTANHGDPNVSFLIDGVEVYTTGNVPKTEKWRQYGFSFVTTATQSSITLTLRNNAPGGIGNDLGLDNISFRPCGPSSFIGIDSDTTIFLCVDDDPLTIIADIDGSTGQEFAIQWQESEDGFNWTTIEDSIGNTITHTNFEPDDYYYRYYSAANEVNILNEKCRIISDIIRLTILPDTYEVTDTLCEGLMYDFGAQELSTNGLYIENFESQYGCDSTVFLDLVFVPNSPISLDVELTDPSCFGFSDGSISIASLGGGNGGLSASLILEGEKVGPDSLPSGVYSLEVLDRFGCETSIDYTLTNPPELSVVVGMDTTIRLGDSLVFNPEYSTFFNTISWQGMGEFNCNSCEEPSFLPYFSGSIVVSAMDDNGCSVSDSLYLTVDDESFLILPNIFSPNDDNVNDFFTMHFYGRSISQIASFQVFDRWGGLVYNRANFEIESGGFLWNGYSGSKIVENGVYSFKLTARLINGTSVERIGSLTVIR